MLEASICGGSQKLMGFNYMYCVVVFHNGRKGERKSKEGKMVSFEYWSTEDNDVEKNKEEQW